jgi:hypothetical protein
MTHDDQPMAQGQGDPVSGPQVTISDEDYRRFVLSWTRHRGRRPGFPRKLKSRLVGLHYILQGFKQGTPYSEEEVNSVIQSRNPFAMDHVQIRRYMVDYGMLGRRDDGSQYRVSLTHLALARWDPAIPGASPFSTA